MAFTPSANSGGLRATDASAKVARSLEWRGKSRVEDSRGTEYSEVDERRAIAGKVRRAAEVERGAREMCVR
jgi:hypothetical protein